MCRRLHEGGARREEGLEENNTSKKDNNTEAKPRDCLQGRLRQQGVGGKREWESD